MARALLISLLLLCAFPALAQSVDPKDLDALTKAQAQAKAKAAQLAKETEVIETQISGFKEDLRRSAAESASYERAGREIQNTLKKLSREEIRLSGRLSDDRKTQSDLLAALQRLSMTPPAIMTLRAKTAQDAARASMVMGSITQQLENRAQSFSGQLTELSAVRKGMDSERKKLAETELALTKKRESIRALVKTKAARAASLSDNQKREQKRAENLAAKADDLRELIRQFERAAKDVVPRLKPAPGRAGPRVKPKSGVRPPEPLDLPEGTRFGDARGGLKPPVQGTLKSGYGSGRKGLTVIARRNAQVTAPFTGRIEFAGAFKNYDNVVILNVGESYFMLLTGLGEIFVTSGEMVRAGEPVGLMPSAASETELYIELRKNGAPINPKPWLGNAFTANG